MQGLNISQKNMWKSFPYLYKKYIFAPRKKYLVNTRGESPENAEADKIVSVCKKLYIKDLSNVESYR